MLVVFPFLAYAFVASLVALPVIVKARRAMHTAPPAPAGTSLRVGMATCTATLLLHLAAQVVPPLLAGEYDAILVLVYGWVGPVNYVIAILAVTLLVLGRRRQSATLLGAALGAATSLYAVAPLTLLEAFVLGALGLRTPAF